MSAEIGMNNVFRFTGNLVIHAYIDGLPAPSPISGHDRNAHPTTGARLFLFCLQDSGFRWVSI